MATHEILPLLIGGALTPAAVALGISSAKYSLHPDNPDGTGVAQLAKEHKEGRRLAAQGTAAEMAERRWGQVA